MRRIVDAVSVGALAVLISCAPPGVQRPPETGEFGKTAVSNVAFDCGQFDGLARAAGWQESELPNLRRIMRRESFCCPNVIGQDIIHGFWCDVVGKDNGPPHRSDSGLLMINGIHWWPFHYQNDGRAPWACAQYGVCQQSQLRDPFTNLFIGRKLFERSRGWGPWNL